MTNLITITNITEITNYTQLTNEYIRIIEDKDIILNYFTPVLSGAIVGVVISIFSTFFLEWRKNKKNDDQVKSIVKNLNNETYIPRVQAHKLI